MSVHRNYVILVLLVDGLHAGVVEVFALNVLLLPLLVVLIVAVVVLLIVVKAVVVVVAAVEAEVVEAVANVITVE